MKQEKNSFTQKEIAVAINNALVFAKAPNKTGRITDERLRRLQEYSLALLSPITEEIEEEFLKPEEAVLICLAGALYFQMKWVMGTDKLPMGETVRVVLEKK